MSKILDYANSIGLETLEQVAKIISEHPENEWCNEPEGFEVNLRKRPIFATRAVPIHNANGYAGSIYQFLWKSEMDYYNLTGDPTQEWEPQKASYTDQLSGITTLPELYAFREMLKVHLGEYKELWRQEAYKPGSEHAKSMDEAGFFIQRAEAQIKHLESQGVFLASVAELKPAPKPESAERTKIEKEAARVGLLRLFRELQLLAGESEWVYDSENFNKFDKLYIAGLVVRLSIEHASRYAYMWRHDMDYESFFQVKTPE